MKLPSLTPDVRALMNWLTLKYMLHEERKRNKKLKWLLLPLESHVLKTCERILTYFYPSHPENFITMGMFQFFFSSPCSNFSSLKCFIVLKCHFPDVNVLWAEFTFKFILRSDTPFLWPLYLL